MARFIPIQIWPVKFWKGLLKIKEVNLLKTVLECDQHSKHLTTIN